MNKSILLLKLNATDWELMISFNIIPDFCYI